MHTSIGKVALFAVAVLLGSIASAAVPPLSLAELGEQSQVIITGQVVSVTTEVRELNQEGFTDTLFHITLSVKSVQKGEDALAGATVKATTWQPLARPDGFAGHQGQNFVPKKGDNVRIYCTVEEERLFVLEPNGIAKISGGKKDKGKEQPLQSP